MAEAVRKLEYFEEEVPRKILSVQKNNKKHKLLAKRRKLFLIGLYSLFFVTIFASALLTLSNFTKINALNVEIRQVDATIKQVEKTNMDLVAEMEKLKSEKDIVHEARTKLGMIYPEQTQIVYFTLEDTNVPEKANTNIISSIFSTFTGSNN